MFGTSLGRGDPFGLPPTLSSWLRRMASAYIFIPHFILHLRVNNPDFIRQHKNSFSFVAFTNRERTQL